MINKDTTIYGKVPPQAIDIENAILGVLLNDYFIVPDVLEFIPTPEVFYSESNKKIYTAIKTLFDKGVKVDMLTVTDELRKMNELENIGGAYAISQLFGNIISSAHWKSHCQIVIEKYIKREQIRIGMEMAAKGYDDGEDCFDTLETSIQQLNNIFDNEGETCEGISSVVIEFNEDLNKAMNNPKHLLGHTTGIGGIDSITHGFQQQQLIILAARPSQRSEEHTSELQSH